ncbi:polysaccharide biosynthesis protein [Citrobacter portucalensis]|nr:polysaccharide biosynthesis protein [Citrobacter portucalensis]
MEMMGNKSLTGKGVILTFSFIPVQVLVALFFNFFLAKNASAEMLNEWFAFVSFTAFFSLLEFSYPTLAVNFFNGKHGNAKGAFSYFIKHSLIVVVPFQLLFTFGYTFLINSSFFFFGLGLIIRSLANLINSYLYANKYIVIDKSYRFISAVIMPVSFILAAHIFALKINLHELMIAWFISSLVCLCYAIVFCYINFREKDYNVDGSFSLPFKNNIKLFLTVLPAIFIYTLSIHYLELFGAKNKQGDVILYGLFLQIFNIYNLIIILVASYLIPTISKKYHEGESVVSVTFKILDLSVMLSLMAISFIVLLGGDGFKLMLQDKVGYISECYVISIAIIFFIETCQVVLTSIGTAVGVYNFHKQSLASAVIVFVLSYFFIPKHGVIGLMSSIIAAQLVTCFVFNPLFVLKVIGVNKRGYAKKVFIHFISVVGVISLGLLTVNMKIEFKTLIFLILIFALSPFLFVRLKFLFQGYGRQ